MSLEYPIRYRPLPHGPKELAALHDECTALLDRATELDADQRALADELGKVRTQLAERRLVMWPQVDRREVVHAFRVTRRGGPPPIPPVAKTALPLTGKHLRSTALAALARNGRAMTLVEIHRQLHLYGYAIASRQPVQRLANALAYEVSKGRAERVGRGSYKLGLLNPGARRRISRVRLERAAAPSTRH